MHIVSIILLASFYSLASKEVFFRRSCFWMQKSRQDIRQTIYDACKRNRFSQFIAFFMCSSTFRAARREICSRPRFLATLILRSFIKKKPIHAFPGGKRVQCKLGSFESSIVLWCSWFCSIASNWFAKRVMLLQYGWTMILIKVKQIDFALLAAHYQSTVSRHRCCSMRCILCVPYVHRIVAPVAGMQCRTKRTRTSVSMCVRQSRVLCTQCPRQYVVRRWRKKNKIY